MTKKLPVIELTRIAIWLRKISRISMTWKSFSAKHADFLLLIQPPPPLISENITKKSIVNLDDRIMCVHRKRSYRVSGITLNTHMSPNLWI